MKKQICLIGMLFVCLSQVCIGQRSFEWADKVGDTGGGTDGIFSVDKIKTDKKGNVYIIGIYNGSIAFPNGVITANNSVGYYSTFLAKYNASGQVMWGINPYGNFQINGPDYDFDIDTVGNVYFSGPGVFAADGVVGKLDTAGNLVWSQEISGPAGWNFESAKVFYDNITSEVDVAFRSGGGTGSVNFSGSVTVTLPNNSNELFHAKYSDTGAAISAKYVATTDALVGIVGDVNNNLYIETTNAGLSLSIYKYNVIDTLISANSYTSIANENLDATDIFCSGDSLYLTGKFQLGILELGSKTTTSNAQFDFFVSVLDTNLLQARLFSGNGSLTSQAYGYNIKVDGGGYLYVSGYDGQGSIGTPNFSMGTGNCFVIKYRPDGTTAWLKSYHTGQNNDQNNTVVMALSRDNNSIYVSGVYTGSATFDTDTVATSLVTQDGYIAKFGQCSLSVPVIAPNNNISICQGNSDTLSIQDSSVNYLWSNSETTPSIVVSSSGTYGVTISDQTGCSAVALPVTVTLHNPPAIPTITTSENLLISSSATGNQWYRNGEEINGATGHLDTLTQSGIYTLVVTDSNGCQSMSLPDTIVGVGIDNINSTACSLQLHPNPFTTQATVQYTLPDGSKNAALIIYDMLGRQRNSYALNNHEGQININASGLSSGVYLYSLVIDGKTRATKKMVVQE